MRLDHIFDVDWRYDFMSTVPPSEAADGRMYGQGSAEFRGRLAGTAAWSNLPRLRRERALPDARGTVDVGDGRFVLFTLTGLSSLTDGTGVHVMMFTTDDTEHEWLNDVLAVGEGGIDPQRGVLAMRYYACEPEKVRDVSSL